MDMNAITVAEDRRLMLAKELVQTLGSGDEARAGQILDELTKLRESELFKELGKLTRELHEALNAFRYDDRLRSLVSVDIPDAKERLNYVISMTEQAASRTLSAVEESLPICGALVNRAGSLHREWQRFMRREMQAAEFRDLCERLIEFLAWIGSNAPRVHTNLSEVLMAQGFQDLTGQIIHRVITLVENVEQNLVNLVRLTGQKMIPAEAPVCSPEKLDGPQIPGKNNADAVSGQDEVDSLLSSLGF
jgi:chemotaxis protein CheZ